MTVQALVVGGGTVGLSTVLFLAGQGVSSLVVESQDGPAIHPRAIGLGPRTGEFLRQAGLQDALNQVVIHTPTASLGKIYARTLAEAKLNEVAPVASRGSGWPWSPAVIGGSCPQTRLDSVLLPAAVELGASIRYSTRLVSVEQDSTDVKVTVDGPEGREVIEADYLIAADGARSDVRAALNIGTSGPGVLGKSMLLNILFRADLSAVTHGQPFTNCMIAHPDAPGMLVTVDGEKEWIFHTECDPSVQTMDEFGAERCADLIRTAVGLANLEVEVLSTLPWRTRGQLADQFQVGRVFLVGDAAHTVPPVGAFGLNTGIADAHNLAWKLAAVIKGKAGAALLETYESERRPVAALVLEQALIRLANPRLHWDQGPEAPAARAEAGVINAPIVHMGYRYDSAAIIDAQPELPSREDITLTYDGAPGSRLPHSWVKEGVSTLDLVGTDFAVLSGHDLDASWLGDDTVLVRPDHYIGWRASNPSANDITKALNTILAI